MSWDKTIVNLYDGVDPISGITPFAKLCCHIINSRSAHFRSVSSSLARFGAVECCTRYIVHVSANDARVSTIVPSLLSKGAKVALLWHDPPILGNNASALLERMGANAFSRALRRSVAMVQTRLWFRRYGRQLVATIVLNRRSLPIANRLSRGNVLQLDHPQYEAVRKIPDCAVKRYDFLVFGHVSPSKGVRELIMVLGECTAGRQRIRLAVAGDVNIRYKRYVEECKRIGRYFDNLEISWIGRVPDERVEELLKSTHVLALPYKNGRFVSASGPLSWARTLDVFVVLNKASYLEGLIDGSPYELALNLADLAAWKRLVLRVLEGRLPRPGLATRSGEWEQFAGSVDNLFRDF